MVAQLKGDVWVLGDLHFLKLSWDSEYIPSVRPGCSFPQLYEDFISILDDCNLVQMVTEPTRGENILDLFLTSNHTLVKNVAVHPGISDHNLVYSEVLTKPVETRQIPRSSYLHRRTDWEGFKTYMDKVKEDFLANSTFKSVEELWTSFKSLVNEGLSRFILCKKDWLKEKSFLITQSIKRLIRKRDSLYQKHKRSLRTQDRKHFITTWHMVKAKIKQAYDCYLEDLLGTSKPQQP